MESKVRVENISGAPIKVMQNVGNDDKSIIHPEKAYLLKEGEHIDLRVSSTFEVHVADETSYPGVIP